MEALVLTDDDLKLLEKRFGPDVRQMGSWNSDGTFGYASIPMLAMEKAAEALERPNLIVSLASLQHTSERTKAFIGLLETLGPALIDGIFAAYRDGSRITTGTRLAPKPPKQETEAYPGGRIRGRQADKYA
jgi:hypothetical protein